MSLSEMMSSPESELSQLKEHILELFNTYLCDYSMKVMHEKLHHLHRGCYYLGLHQEESALPVVDHQRLQGALRMANTHVRLLLALMEMLLEEICSCRQELQAFLLQNEQDQVDFELVSATRSTLKKVHRHLKDFDSSDTRYLGPLDLDNQLIPGSGQLHMPQVNASLCFKLPVEFDRLQSHAKSTTVHLVWSLPGEQCQEPNQFYEIQTKILHPSVGEHGQYEQLAVQDLFCTLENLTPNCFYQFSIKRLDSFNLVYRMWADSLILQTSPVQ